MAGYLGVVFWGSSDLWQRVEICRRNPWVPDVLVAVPLGALSSATSNACINHLLM